MKPRGRTRQRQEQAGCGRVEASARQLFPEQRQPATKPAQAQLFRVNITLVNGPVGVRLAQNGSERRIWVSSNT
jgi:hypothetical protein